MVLPVLLTRVNNDFGGMRLVTFYLLGRLVAWTRFDAVVTATSLYTGKRFPSCSLGDADPTVRHQLCRIVFFVCPPPGRRRSILLSTYIYPSLRSYGENVRQFFEKRAFRFTLLVAPNLKCVIRFIFHPGSFVL